MSLTGLVTMLLMRQLTLVGGWLALLLLMPVVICPEFVVGGILFFLIYIGSSLPFLGLLLNAAGSVAADVQVALAREAEVARRDIHGVCGSGPGRKRVRQNRKTQHTLWV